MAVKILRSELARNNFRDILDDVQAGDEVVIERYNKPTAVVISHRLWSDTAGELARLRRMIEADRQFAEIDAGNFVNLEDLDKELAAMNANPSKP